MVPIPYPLIPWAGGPPWALKQASWNLLPPWSQGRVGGDGLGLGVGSGSRRGDGAYCETPHQPLPSSPFPFLPFFFDLSSTPAAFLPPRSLSPALA